MVEGLKQAIKSSKAQVTLGIPIWFNNLEAVCKAREIPNNFS